MKRVGLAAGAIVVALVGYFVLRPGEGPTANRPADGETGSGCSVDVQAGDAGAHDAAPPPRTRDAGPIVRPAIDASAGRPGAIVGEVHLSGTPPPPDVFGREGDPYCKNVAAQDIASVMVRDRRLQNVVVRIAGSMRRPASGRVVLDQQGCVYRPRVQAIVAGQTIVVKNRDQTMHNVHTYPPEGERTFNRAQVPGGPDFEVTYSTHGAFVGFRCDVHPWMAAWVSVTNHPFFDVTTEDGVFEIADVPPGEHEVEAWHERMGSKRRIVRVGEGEVVQLVFEYDGTEVR